MDTVVLRELGFSENEINVYLELQKAGELAASKLADRAGINRTLCYQILNKLSRKGLAGYVLKNNVKCFQAAHPDKLLDYLKEKQSGVQQLIPSILSLKPPHEKDYSVELFEGKEGLKTVLNDILNSKTQELLDFTSGLTTVVLPELYLKQFHKKRISLKIRSKFLFNDTEIGRKRGSEVAGQKFSEVRFLPKGLGAPCHIYIYAQKVGIALWSKDAPFGIIIKSDEIFNRFKEFFNWIWERSSKS